MGIRELEQAVGGLSKPSKMPGYAYSLPATACPIGSQLVKVSNSVCSGCYALKGRYRMGHVKRAMARRLESISKPEWAEWMSELLRLKYRKRTGKDRVFRWHDSGDLQSVEHLSKIVEIARALPDIRFWLPTRERGIISNFCLDGNVFPDNMSVRISMSTIGEIPPEFSFPYGKNVRWSTVAASEGYQCPARDQDNQCGECRACWDSSVISVDYPLH